jgi:tryptophan-rich sensory protein
MPGIVKTLMICFFLLPFAICLAIGRWFSAEENWKRDVGIVLIVSSLAGAAMSFTIAAVLRNPEFNKKIPPEHTDFMSDYLFAAIWFAAWLLLGAALVVIGRNEAKRSQLPRPLAR